MLQPIFRTTALMALCGILAAACAAPAPTGTGGTSTQSQTERTAGPKRLTAAIAGDPHTLFQKLNPSSTVRGVEEVERLIHAGLTNANSQGMFAPELAEAVASIENGLWRLLPDGRMETTWKIRAGAIWHDGTPVTSADAVFVATVGRDRELPAFRDKAWEFVDQVEAPDARTVTVTWHKPYIDADKMFSSDFALLLLQHALASAYAADKASFTQLPFWTEEVVGAGPYRMREFVRGSHMILEANDQYVLGRPKVATIEVKFIVDPNTLVANVLAGTVDLTLGRGISFDQAQQVRGMWREGRIEVPITSLVQLFPQHMTPNPAVIANAQFRRGLLHAIDREEMAATLQSGFAPVAHSFVSPEEPDYRAIEGGIVRYEFDQRRATQLIESLGYTKGPDGINRDGAGSRLSVELRATGTDTNQKSMFAVGDHWKRVGVESDMISVPPQQASDLEYRATFPGFSVQRQGGSLDFLRNFHSVQARLPETRWVGNNNGRYLNPELDGLIERFESTIPVAERMAVANQIVRHITGEVVEIPLFFDGQPALIANRIVGVSAGGGGAKRTAANANEWNLR